MLDSLNEDLVPVADAFSLECVADYPKYNHRSTIAGILHMSIGGFHRSHQARYIHDYLQQRNEPWAIHAIGLLDEDGPHLKDLGDQENLYTLLERSGGSDVVKIIGSLCSLSHAPTKPGFVIERLASDHIKIVSLTITEKGYCYDSDGNLNFDHPMIQADFIPGSFPVSALGFLFAGCEMRMRNGGAPFTLMSCDNLVGNGNVAKRVLLQYAQARDKSVARWIQQNVSFPNSMVDRITPAVTKETTDLLAKLTGIYDKYPVVSESFSQWIIEDNFINGRPNLEEVGVQFVDDVEPFEKMKVRLLNGSHSALSYISYLLGFRQVDIAMADKDVRKFVVRYMNEEVRPSLDETPGIDLDDYQKTLVERFSNAAISDAVQRLAQDGSQKIPNSVVPPLQYQLANSGSIELLSFAIAAWYRYLLGTDEQGNIIEIFDPRSVELKAIVLQNPGDISKFLAVEEIFGTDLGNNSIFAGTAKKHLDSINAVGIRTALQEIVGD